MGMRRLFIIRKDLHLSAGKLGAMVAHCAEGYWIWLIRKNLTEENGRVHASFDLDREIYDDYLNGRITKTICEAKNLNKHAICFGTWISRKSGFWHDKRCLSYRAYSRMGG